MDDATVVVAGAGLAGLVAARRLADAGADVTVVERRESVGGRVRSREVDGFTVDRGFQVLFTTYPMVRRELDLDALDLRYFRPGAVIARPSRRSVLGDPLRDPGAAVASLRNPEVTLTDKLRTLALRQDLSARDPDALFSRPDATIRSYLREWGFTESYLEHFVAPFYGGITLDRSLETSRRVFDYTFKMLSEGGIALPAAGMGAVPAQLAAHVRETGGRVQTDEAVVDVRDGGDGVVLETSERSLEADAAVVATDPRSAQELTGVASIPTAGRGCVTQYYRLERPLGDGKRLLLNAADATPNAVAPLSTVAPGYAPPGTELVSATFLDGDALEADAGALAEETRRALASWYAGRGFEDLAVVDTTRVEFAQFDQPPGIHDGLPGPRTPGGRVYLAGDYTRWSSIQGAMRSGADAAAAVTTDLG